MAALQTRRMRPSHRPTPSITALVSQPAASRSVRSRTGISAASRAAPATCDTGTAPKTIRL